jgi:hypothetical protein
MDDHFINLPGEMPNTLDPYAGQHQYSPNPFMGGGRMPFGIGSILMSAFGNKMWPIPMPGTSQGVYDAVWQREHDMQMMHVARQTVSSWYPFQNMGGMNQNSMLTQAVSSLMSQPDGLAATIMSPVLGGNPVQAQMAAYANLQGIGAAGLGTVAGVTGTQIRGGADAFESQFYNQDIKKINKDLGDKKKAAILANIKRANILGLSDQQGTDLFNESRNNEIVPGTTAYSRINRAGITLDGLQSKISSMESTGDIQKYLEGADLGDMTSRFKEQFGSAVSGSAEDRAKAFAEGISGVGESLKGKTSDVQAVVDALKQLQTEGKSKEQVMKDVDALKDKFKLDDSAADIVRKGVEEGMQKGSQILSKAVGEKLQQKPISEAAKDIQSVANSMLMQKITRGVNYANTLGFNYEDLVGARDEAIRQRFVGGPGTDLNKLSAQFGGGQMVKTMDAMRSAFGNDLTGKQLIQKANEFVGYSNYDLNKTEDQKDLEDNLRTLKATARVTGIDFDTIMNVEGQAQNAAAMNPLTAHLGGRELGPMVSQAAQQVLAMSSQMSSEDVRYLGGPANMFRSAVEGQILSSQQPIATQLAAMDTYFVGNDKAQEAVRSYAKNGDMTAGGWARFQEDLANQTGVNGVDLQRYSQYNPSATRKGFQGEGGAAFRKAGGQATVQGILQGLDFYYGGGEAGASMKDEAQKLIQTGQFGKLLTDKRFNMAEFAPAWEDALKKNYLYDYAVGNNSKFKAADDQVQERVKSSVELEKIVSYKMGKLNAPTIQRVVQAIASGDMSRDGLKPLASALGIGDEFLQNADLVKNTDYIQKMTAAGSVEDLLNISQDVLHKSGVSTQTTRELGAFSELAKKYNINSDDVTKIRASGGTLNELKKIIGNKSAMTTEDQAREFYRLAGTADQQMASGGLLDKYSGDFSKDSLTAAMKKPLVDQVVDYVGGTDERAKAFNDWMQKTGEQLSSGQVMEGDAGSANRVKLGKAIQALGGKKGETEGKVFDVLAGVAGQGDSGFQNIDGTYKLTGALGQFGQAVYGKEETFTSEDDAKKAVSSLRAIADSDSTVTGIVSEKGAADETVKQMKEQSEAAITTASGVTKILGSITEMTAALNRINGTLSK